MAIPQTFIDTLFVVALINQRDRYHEQATEMADLYEGQTLLTTEGVLLEIGNALARGYKADRNCLIAPSPFVSHTKTRSGA